MHTERLARTGSYSLFGSAFAALAALGLTVIVGNGLGAYGTGLFFQAMGLFTIASQMLRLGTNSSIIKMIAEQRAFGRTGESWRTMVIGVVPVVGVSIVAAVLVSMYAPQLAGWLGSPGERDNLAVLLRDMAPFAVLSAVLVVLNTGVRMLCGVRAFTLLQNVLSPLSRLVVVAVAVYFAWDALSAFRAWLAVIPVWLVVTILVLARPVLLDWRQRRAAQIPARAAARGFWAFSSTRALGATFETALEWSDILIVSALASPAEAGVYAVATRMVRAGQVVDAAVRVAVSPTISQLLARSERSAASSLNTKVTRATVLSNWPYYLILATMGPAMLSLFGPEFTGGAVVLIILSGAMMVSAAAGMLQSILLQGGRSSWQMGNKGMTLGISIALNLLLVPVWGILGAAVTWAFAVLAETALASWQVHKRMNVSLQPAKLLLAMAVPVVVFGVGGTLLRLVFGATLPALILGAAGLGAIYLVALWLLRERLGIVSLWREVPVVGRLAARPVASVVPDDAGQRVA